MKIGVFGDSFATGGHPDMWAEKLKSDHGHEVFCHGEPGSSLLFGAQRIDELSNEYDFIIWTLTTLGRFSFFYEPEKKWCHLSAAGSSKNTIHVDSKLEKMQCMANDYLSNLVQWRQEEIMGACVARDYLRIYNNLMIIPAFSDPLYTDFELSRLSHWELELLLPGWDLGDVFSHYNEKRPAHLCRKNNKILADLIAANLKPGIFQANYDDFVRATQPIEELFSRK